MSHVFHRQARHHYPVAVRGAGAFIEDSAGKRYLDASGGAAVSCLGHDHPHVVAAIKGQLERLPFAHTGFFTNPAMEALADRLIAAAPGDLERVFFVSGGSEAVEAALKLARQYFLEIGQPQRRRIITRRQSYHGNTLGALAVGGNEWRRRPFQPLLIETTLQRQGPDTVAAFICEPVVGATAGAVPPVAGYLARVREICDRHGVLLIFDEVMCGMGRTGYRFACDEDGVAPDLLVVAKGLGAGFQPIGATLVARRVFQAIHDGSGSFQHSHTYMGHPAACAGALAVQEVIDAEDLLANVRRRGEQLRAALDTAFGDHPHVGDIRGRGLFLALELVTDRATKTPFDPALKIHQRVKAAAMTNGLMVYPSGGTVDGVRGDHVLLAPPFIVDEALVTMIVDRLAASLAESLPAATAASA